MPRGSTADFWRAAEAGKRLSWFFDQDQLPPRALLAKARRLALWARRPLIG